MDFPVVYLFGQAEPLTPYAENGTCVCCDRSLAASDAGQDYCEGCRSLDCDLPPFP